jgi:ketosteroid isomerase-like protein
MRRVIVLAAVAILMATSAAATDQTDVVKTVRQFVDSFNKGDMNAATAACASPASIIDEFPPYAWEGASACAEWAHDFEVGAQQLGMTAGHVGMGKPLHVEVTGDRAYAIFPVTFSYKQKGKLVTEPPGKLIVVLQKSSGAWKVASWTWSKK